MGDGPFSERIGLPDSTSQEQAVALYGTTGLHAPEILDVAEMIHRAAEDSELTWPPPILGLYKSVVVTLAYLRRNRVQVELAETYDVSQATVSRAIARSRR